MSSYKLGCPSTAKHAARPGPIPGAGQFRCPGYWCTWSRNTPGTTATPTCCAKRSTARLAG